MKTDYYKFFKYLYDHYDLAGWVAIDKYAISIKPNQSLADLKHIKDMLIELEEEGIIEWKADIKTTNEHGIYSYHWLDIEKYKKEFGQQQGDPSNPIRVEVKLTRVKGIDYAEQYINAQSNLTNNYWIRFLTIGLLIVTAAGIVVQVKQCSISEQQKESTGKTMLPPDTVLPSDTPKIHEVQKAKSLTVSTDSYKIDTAKQKDTTHKSK